MIREHSPITLNTFNGLYQRGETEEVPLDHFSDCENLQPIGDRAFATRFGIDMFQNVIGPLGNIVRFYNYIMPGGSTLLVLTWDGTTGKIYHVVNETTVHGPILTKVGMHDFAFVANNGYAYISPIGYYTIGDLNLEKGLQSEFLYVYLGAGSAARKAAGNSPSGTMTVANGAAGHTDAGNKLFAVVFESDTGWLSAPSAFSALTVTNAILSVSFSNIPISLQSHITKRHIVATKSITSYNGDPTGYTYYFIPNATVPDNVTVVLGNISFYDADLLDDASHLLDNYSEIPAGATLGLYHNRLVLAATYADQSLALVAEPGEPEAINQISGLLVVPLDGNPITNNQELRDVLYVFKRARTVAFVDNGDDPSTWEMTTVDAALGTCIHGVATVIDSGSSMTDYLIIATYKGIMIFSGTYIIPELSWKIADFWYNQDRNLFRYIQIVNEPVSQNLYCTLPDRRLLVGNYTNGLDPGKIRWWPWRFEVKLNTIALVNIDQVIFGAEGRLV